MGSLCKARVCR